MNRTYLKLIFNTTLAFIIVSSLAIAAQSQTQPGAGIGIRNEGPDQAIVGETISYSIIVYNLGNYTITNLIITDKLPNQTSVTWNGPNLLPKGQPGDSFTLSNILYTVRQQDILGGEFNYVLNNANTSGYSNIQGLKVPVHAETNFATFLVSPVGGYSFSLETKSILPQATTVFAAWIVILGAALPVTKRYSRRQAKS